MDLPELPEISAYALAYTSTGPAAQTRGSMYPCIYVYVYAKVKARMLYDLLSLSDAIPERHVPPEAALQVRLVLVAQVGGLCL